jgi:hypothetical protein
MPNRIMAALLVVPVRPARARFRVRSARGTGSRAGRFPRPSGGSGGGEVGHPRRRQVRIYL